MKLDRWLCCSLVLGLVGCAAPEVYNADTAPEFMTVKATAFYLHGPLQGGQPDELAPETFVHILRKESGYSFVKLEDERSGYVATEDLRTAPPAGRAVDGAELFPAPPPEMMEPLPEPDLAMPVAEVPVKEPADRTAKPR